MLTESARTRLAAYLSGASVGNPITHLSLHSAIPNASGSGEITGGSPAYARKSVTWGTAISGVLPQTGSAVFDVPAGTVVAVGLWSSVTAGTFLGYLPSNGGTLFGFGVGVASSPVMSPAHGLVTGDTVTVAAPKIGQSLPTGYAASTLYSVTVIDTDRFTLSDRSTQIVVVPTTSAPLVWQRYVSDVFAAQGSLTVSGIQIVVGA
jgi:hypothetical protein